MLNKYDEALHALDLKPYQQQWCCVCGKKREHGHHLVYRSHGGKKDDIISLCAECHQRVHNGLLEFGASDWAPNDGNLWVRERPNIFIEYFVPKNLQVRIKAFEWAWES